MLLRAFYTLLLVCCCAQVFAQKVVEVRVDGTINPVAAAYIERGLEAARDGGATCLLIRLNTPGGLLKSTRNIVSNIMESPVPVVVYVSPGGAHAGSAGVFITLSAHVAAMAPGTNIGAAHPVSLQGSSDSTISEKSTNDAAAFIRTIAGKRNRNWQWAEEAVRRSVSVTESEALELRVIDLVAPTTEALLQQVHGRQVVVADGRTVTLQTRGAEVQVVAMRWTEKVLDLISDPSIAYILLLLGMYGLLFELYNPGALVPGIVGVISLILGFYALHTLPINYAGLALIIFAIILFLLEIKITSYGLLTIGGVLSLVLGAMMLIRTDEVPGFLRISPWVIGISTAVTVLFFGFVVAIGLRAQKARPVTGPEGLVGATGEALEMLDPAGMVQVHGEIWKARSVAGPIEKSHRLRVVAVQDLTLLVTHLSS